jgi:hypothetical protein
MAGFLIHLEHQAQGAADAVWRMPKGFASERSEYIWHVLNMFFLSASKLGRGIFMRPAGERSSLSRSSSKSFLMGDGLQSYALIVNTDFHIGIGSTGQESLGKRHYFPLLAKH